MLKRVLRGVLTVSKTLLSDPDFRKYGVMPVAVIGILTAVLGAVLGAPEVIFAALDG